MDPLGPSLGLKLWFMGGRAAELRIVVCVCVVFLQGFRVSGFGFRVSELRHDLNKQAAMASYKEATLRLNQTASCAS